MKKKMKLESLVGKPLDGFSVQRVSLAVTEGEDGRVLSDFRFHGCGEESIVKEFADKYNKRGSWMKVRQAIVLTNGEVAFILSDGGIFSAGDPVKVLS